MFFDLSQIPFSYDGSYLALAELPEHWQGYDLRRGVYLKTVSGSANRPVVARLLFSDEHPATELVGGSLSLAAGKARLDCCFADPATLLIRGSANAALTLDFLTESGPYDYIYELDADGRRCCLANCYKNNTSYALWAQSGEIALEQRWREQTAAFSRVHVSGERGFLLVLREVPREWDQTCPAYDFEACRASAAEALTAFRRGYPDLPDGYEDVAMLGAYVNWSAYVSPRGFLKRPAMLMSKNHMTSVWSWDHCFNALALSYRNPEAAWAQWRFMFDFQDETGRLPDSVNDSKVVWNYVKPPVHGWTLLKMLTGGMRLQESQLAEAYAALERQTRWWLRYRDWDDGLMAYAHGNDSDWDNATVFAAAPPVCSPDLQTFLILQMDALAELAERLALPEQKEAWRRRSDELLHRFLDRCFVDGLPVARQRGTREVIENQSLLPYLCLLLGDRLPEAYRQKTVARLKTGGWFGPHGFATESLDSPAYRADGYWRGPIWAPSTVLLCDGLRRCGEEALAREAAEAFLRMCQRSSFAENFNAVTGEGLRDRAYTWTSSAAFILAHDFLNQGCPEPG